MKNAESELLYRKRTEHIGVIAAKLSVAASVCVVIVGVGTLLHQMFAAITIMMWFAVTVCLLGIPALAPKWRAIPGKITDSMDFVNTLFGKAYTAFYPLAIIAIACAAASIILAFFQSGKRPTGRIVLCALSLIVAIVTMIAVGGAAA